MRKARVVDATLTGNSGDFYLVSLIAPAEEHSHGSEEVGEVEEQPVTRFEVLDKIPDGEYILEYFSPRPFRGKARVVGGTLQIL